MLSSTSYADTSDGQNWTWEVRGRRQSILALLKYESLKHDQLMSSCMAFSQAFMVNWFRWCIKTAGGQWQWNGRSTLWRPILGRPYASDGVMRTDDDDDTWNRARYLHYPNAYKLIRIRKGRQKCLGPKRSRFKNPFLQDQSPALKWTRDDLEVSGFSITWPLVWVSSSSDPLIHSRERSIAWQRQGQSWVLTLESN